MHRFILMNRGKNFVDMGVFFNLWATSAEFIVNILSNESFHKPCEMISLFPSLLLYIYGSIRRDFSELAAKQV